MVALNVIIVLGIVIAGSFLLYFLGDFIVTAIGIDTKKHENQKLLEHKNDEAETHAINSSVVVTDYISEEAEQVKEEGSDQQQDAEAEDEEKRIAEARAALERRKAEILKRMQAQIEDEDEAEDEEVADEVEEKPVQTEEEEEEDVLRLINTDDEAEDVKDIDEDAMTAREEALQAEIEQLKNQLGVEKEKYVALAKEFEESKSEQVVATEDVETLGSRSHYQAMLDEKVNTLKVVEKEFKQCKKDFLPLYKVHNTLAKDEKKLHRREAIVAKQKVVLYGVNNYADIDEEKAKKLAEDLDLLDGLKLSVNHCKEVMEKNKDRYPILERLYNTLKKQVSTLKQEIEDIRTVLNSIDGEVEEEIAE